tara:strand:+ start:230 stop:541 length:312 start_codon:yes stop_codon:yes gene_type:complete
MGEGAVPNLVERKAKVFLGGALKHSHEIKHKYINQLYNFGLAIVLILIVGGFLLFKYKGKLTPVEKAIKKKKEYEHVLIQLKKLENKQFKENQTLLTDLPIPQ